MRRYMAIALVALAGFAAILATAFYGPKQVHRWDQYYIWELLSGKAHGGQHIRVSAPSRA
jgi:hypothetical protein